MGNRRGTGWSQPRPSGRPGASGRAAQPALERPHAEGFRHVPPTRHLSWAGHLGCNLLVSRLQLHASRLQPHACPRSPLRTNRHDDGTLLQRNAAQTGAPADAVRLHTIDTCDDTCSDTARSDGSGKGLHSVWGIHCGCLLPMADECSVAVLAAHAAMARHVAGLLLESSG